MFEASKDSIAHFQMWWMLYWHAVLAAIVLCLAVSIMVRCRFRKWPVILMLFPAAVAVLWLRYCAVNPWISYQYRLTVTLDVDGKTISNSEVYEVLKARNPIRNRLTLGGVSNEQVVVFGEAIYFDVGGKPLLVTMAGSGGTNVPNAISVLARMVLRFGTTKLTELPPFKMATAEKIGADVPIDQLPIMITFADPTRPDTWRRVKLANPSQEFSQNFSIKSAHLQLTTERPGWPELPDHLPCFARSDPCFQRPFQSQYQSSRTVARLTKEP
ncbi:hypothetical protein AUC68_00430 [Methyloceanibacter methanicus]|uniref:Uncharacterized protein n=1 Tax=Methyloceanibacter methanicus TaxID=1774968 RepID=A0A1E3W6C9_9HYPH|nr:hypothetical protein [Methyloceanibacter methanicus]ODS01363.1 hypothetical protein AUC68_00430 [Methyloceanibacter methanicus]